jgi:hypothetical protein
MLLLLLLLLLHTTAATSTARVTPGTPTGCNTPHHTTTQHNTTQHTTTQHNTTQHNANAPVEFGHMLCQSKAGGGSIATGRRAGWPDDCYRTLYTVDGAPIDDDVAIY